MNPWTVLSPLCGCGCSLGWKLGGEAEPLPLPQNELLPAGS